MILYDVKYKQPNQWFWRTLKDIREDGIVEEIQQRWFYDKFNHRYEIPNSSLFKFSIERHQLIEELQEKNRQKMKDNTGFIPEQNPF
tara:strand:+ start:64 stop:324 length:261 start_codon:yes stop_codon:yes gene_type:complete